MEESFQKKLLTQIDQGEFIITAISVNCNPENSKKGHLQPCDFEEIEE